MTSNQNRHFSRPSQDAVSQTGNTGRHFAQKSVSSRSSSMQARNNSPYSSQKNKAKPKRKIALFVIGLAVVATLVVSVYMVFFSTNSHSSVKAGVEVELTIPQGAGGETIAQILHDNHVIENSKEFYAAVEELNAAQSLKPGNYVFYTLQDPKEVVKQLVEGPNAKTVRLVIPEGKTVTQTAAIVEDTYGISADTFINQAKASNYIDDYSFLKEAANDSLEGFLFPKTYSFIDTPTADQIIRAMLNQYEVDVLQTLDFDAARNKIAKQYGVELSNYELINLASIVEREGLNAEQRAHVASVFLNRLAGKMPDGLLYLNSDATLMYVTGGEVTGKDISSIDSPYNSYKYEGLPPTPICSPSVESISATLDPLDSDDLYFYITQDEEHFSKTYEEHMQSW